jgi:transposase-like protein
MAGRPKFEAFKATFTPDQQDGLWLHLESGGTMTSYAKELGVDRGMLYAWIKEGGEERKERLSRARETQANWHVEDATELLDTADESNYRSRKEIANHKRWLAERLDRETWGTGAGQSVNISISELHLSLLKQPSAPPIQLQPIEVHALGDGGQRTSTPEASE